MSSTPVKLKRSPAFREKERSHRKRRSKGANAELYTPNVDRLKANFVEEQQKFLESLKGMIDKIDHNRINILFPIEKQVKKLTKESQKLNLHLQSTRHWKLFYKAFIDNCDKIIDLFRLDDIRDIDEVIEEAKLPEVLVTFVKDNLESWRHIFENKKWMNEYKKVTEEHEKLEAKIKEDEEKEDILKDIADECERLNIKMDEMSGVTSEEDIIKWFQKRVKLVMLSREMGDQLKRLPSSSKKNSTREWCKRHYENMPTFGSDEESTSSDPGSSINGEKGDAASDLSFVDNQQDSEMEPCDSFDAFFASKGL